MLQKIHTYRTRYLLLGVAILGMELYLAYRVSYTSYMYFILRGDQYSAWASAIFFFVGIGVAGFTLASRPSHAGDIHLSFGSWKFPWLLISTILADWLSVFYLTYQHNFNEAILDPANAAIAISYCLIAVFPFGLGVLMENAHEKIQTEKEEEHKAYVQDFGEDIQRKAMQKLKIEAKKDKSILASYLPTGLEQYRRVIDDTSAEQGSIEEEKPLPIPPPRIVESDNTQEEDTPFLMRNGIQKRIQAPRSLPNRL